MAPHVSQLHEHLTFANIGRPDSCFSRFPQDKSNRTVSEPSRIVWRDSLQDVAIDSLDAVEQNIDDAFPSELTKQRVAAFAADPKALQAYSSTIFPVDDNSV